MKLPRELIIYILKIKSHTAWRVRKIFVHSLLSSRILDEEPRVFFFGNPNILISVRQTPFWDITTEQSIDGTFSQRMTLMVLVPTNRVWMKRKYNHCRYIYLARQNYNVSVDRLLIRVTNDQ